jgi:hypothetical protein
MLRAYSLQRKARVCHYGLAVGGTVVLATWGAMFAFQQERLPGLKEVDVAFPSPSRITPEATVPMAVPGLESVVPMMARLPHPPLTRPHGVLCDPNGDVSFGASFAMHGNQLAVGAIKDDTAGLEAGAVYIYDRDPERGEWRYTERILADAEQKLAARTLGRRQAMFGRRVALANGVLAVMQGSIYHGGPTGEFPEHVYVFGVTGNTAPDSDGNSRRWRQEARLPTPDGGAGHGRSIAFLDSHTLLVAAPMATPLGDAGPQGAVYVYQRQFDVAADRYRWVERGQLRPPPGAPSDLLFAGSLAASDNLVAVGLVNLGGGTKAESGRAWTVPIYRRASPYDAPAAWVLTGGVEAPPHATGAFGTALAMHRDVLVVQQADHPLEGTHVGREPRLFVYRAASGAQDEPWEYEGELPKSSAFISNYIGPGLATDGQWIVVGDGEAGVAGARPGLVWVYHKPVGQPWTLRQTLGPFDPVNSGAFGNVVGVYDGLLLAYGGDRLFHPNHGSVFFRRL